MDNQQWNNVKRFVDVNKRSYDLGYIIGSYLGDGWIEEQPDYRLLGISCIDKDFVEHFHSSLHNLFGSIPKMSERDRIITLYNKTYKRHYFEMKLGCTQLCDWILKETEHKKNIPNWVLSDKSISFKRGVVEGLLDSEGWFAQTRKADVKRNLYRMGFACTNENVTVGLQALLKQFNVRSTGPNLTTCKSGKTLYTIWLNKYDFAKTELQFNISRKQNRIKTFIQEYNIIPSETVCQTPKCDDTVQTTSKDVELTRNS